jgi:16S rRNA processing protein RimM
MEPTPLSNLPPGVSSDNLVTIGEVLKPRGLSGELKVRIACDGPEHFSQCLAGGETYLWKTPCPGGPSSRCPAQAARIIRVRSIRFHEGFALVRFQGVEDIASAELLRGCHIGLPSNRLPPPGEDTYYYFQLEGLVVLLPNGEMAGRVERVEQGPAHHQLVVQPTEKGAKPFRIPMVAAFVKTVDVTAGRILVELPPGLIESQQ